MSEFTPDTATTTFLSAFQSAFPILYQRMLSRFGDPQLAEEISWDCLTHAYERFLEDPSYFETRDLTAWTSRRARWRALDQLEHRQRFVPFASEDEDFPSSAVPHPVAPDEMESRRSYEQRSLTHRCLNQLDEEDRLILSSYHYEGLTDQQIGELLYGNQGTVESRGLRVWRRRKKAYQRLRTILLMEGFELPEDTTSILQAV